MREEANLKKSRRIIKKPRFWRIILQCFVVVSIIAMLMLIVFNKAVNDRLGGKILSLDNDITFTYKRIQTILDEAASSGEVVTLEDDILTYFAVDMADVRIAVDKTNIADTSRKISMNLGFNNESYICDWDSNEDDLREIADYCHKVSFWFDYEVELDSFYYSSSGKTYPSKISVYKVNNLLGIKSLVKTYQLTPNDAEFMNSTERQQNGVRNKQIYISSESINDFYKSYAFVDINGEEHTVEFFTNSSKTIAYTKM